jgi:hypothetical protein
MYVPWVRSERMQGWTILDISLELLIDAIVLEAYFLMATETQKFPCHRHNSNHHAFHIWATAATVFQIHRQRVVRPRIPAVGVFIPFASCSDHTIEASGYPLNLQYNNEMSLSCCPNLDNPSYFCL